MKNIVSFLLVLGSYLGYSQGYFKSGYYVDSNGLRVEGFIKDDDWIKPPSSFMFRASEEASTSRIFTSNIEELYIDETSHYYRKLRLDEYIDYTLKGEKKAVSSQTVFAKLLVSGTASLYQLRLEGEQRYILEMNNSTSNMLVYRKYAGDDGRIREINDFQKVLFENLQCNDSTNIDDFINLKYKLSAILKRVEIYNICWGSESKNYITQRTKGKFGFKLLPAFCLNNYTNAQFSYFYINGAPRPDGDGTSTVVDDVSFEFDNQLTLTLGLELNYELPFLQNRFVLFFAPSFHYIKEDSKTVDEQFFNRPFEISATYTTGFGYVEFPIGIKYSFNIGDKFESYLSLAYGFITVVSDNTSLEISDENNSIEIPWGVLSEDENSLVMLGVGGTLSRRLNIFFNYYIEKIITVNDTVKNNLSGSFSIGAAYKLF